MTSVVDALSGTIVLLVLVYTLQRGFAPSDAEFLLLTAVLVLVLWTCLTTPAGRTPPPPSLRRQVQRLWQPAGRVVEGYVNDLFELPGKVRDILEPRIDSIARGFKGEATQAFHFVGDGKQEQYDRARESAGERDALEEGEVPVGSQVGFRMADFYQDPLLQRSDAEFREAKAAWEARMEAQRAEMERRAQARQNMAERAMPESARRGLEQERAAQAQAPAQREGGGGAASTAEEKGGAVKDIMDFSRAALAQRNKSSETKTDKKNEAEEGDRPLRDENDVPLRFDPAKFKDMVDGFRRADYALCRMKSRDADVYKALLGLGWLRAYQAEKRTRARGSPPSSCRA